MSLNWPQKSQQQQPKNYEEHLLIDIRADHFHFSFGFQNLPIEWMNVTGFPELKLFFVEKKLTLDADFFVVWVVVDLTMDSLRRKTGKEVGFDQKAVFFLIVHVHEMLLKCLELGF